MSYLDRRDLLSADLMTRSISKEGSIKYYNSDKNVANIYMKLMAESPDGAQKEVSVDEASNYTVTIDAIKSKTNQIRTVPGVLSNDLTDETCAIWKFELGEDLTNQIGEVICQTYIKNTTQNLTMRYFAYTVEADKLTGLNAEIVTDPDLPILKELIQEVKETAQTVNNIDNVNVSDTKTYSNKKIEEKFSGVDAQFNTIEKKKADKTEVDIERKRLDNIIANNNTTEGNSELVDMRIGVDGTVYDCAGKSVREQFANNNTKIQDSANKNTEQDTRLNNVEHKNKVQDVFLNGLLNENSDGRLSTNGAGNHLKLEGSKQGLVTVDNVVGDTLVNLVDLSKCENYNAANDICEKTLTTDYEWASVGVIGASLVERLKPNSVYTVLMYISKNTVVGESKFFVNIANSSRAFIESTAIETGLTGIVIKKLTTRADFTGVTMGLFPSINNGKTGQNIAFKYMIIEGDFTNRPIPQQYFKGLQSTFEDKKVTQEMVTAGTELASNLGKYKVNAKVVGKNLFDGELREGKYNTDTGVFEKSENISANAKPIYLNENSIYSINRPTLENGINTRVLFYNKYGKFISSYLCVGNGNFTTPFGTSFINFHIATATFDSQLKIQIEEGTQVTSYEPYFESTHNVYLNSPLLKGDVLECRSDGVYHVHNMGKVVLNGSESWLLAGGDYNSGVNITFKLILEKAPQPSWANSEYLICDKFISKTGANGAWLGVSESIVTSNNNLLICIERSKLITQDVAGFKTWLQTNPITVAYELATSYEEKVSDDKLLLDIFNSSTLSVDSNIPCSSVKATYTSNIVSVVKLDKIQYQQDQVNLDNVYRLTMLETTMGI